MASPQDHAHLLVRAAEILARPGEEVAFAQAGRGTGLWTLNNRVIDVEELSCSGAPPTLAI